LPRRQKADNVALVWWRLGCRHYNRLTGRHLKAQHWVGGVGVGGGGGTLATPTITMAHATMREAKNSSLEMTLYRVARCMATSYSHHAPRISSRPCSDVSFGSRS
jgi:hypothetical protein